MEDLLPPLQHHRQRGLCQRPLPGHLRRARQETTRIPQPGRHRQRPPDHEPLPAQVHPKDLQGTGQAHPVLYGRDGSGQRPLHVVRAKGRQTLRGQRPPLQTGAATRRNGTGGHCPHRLAHSARVCGPGPETGKRSHLRAGKGLPAANPQGTGHCQPRTAGGPGHGRRGGRRIPQRHCQPPIRRTQRQGRRRHRLRRLRPQRKTPERVADQGFRRGSGGHCRRGPEAHRGSPGAAAQGAAETPHRGTKRRRGGRSDRPNEGQRRYPAAGVPDQHSRIHGGGRCLGVQGRAGNDCGSGGGGSAGPDDEFPPRPGSGQR
mmetsp:Transcript_21308/g.46525  ORF Transcript_21308/g.46525 Transcript_21308/m.46525 type:complete len:317 (-) Transcript_21308:450-1400(-)